MLSNTQARNASPSNSNQNLSVHQPRHQFTFPNCSGETGKRKLTRLVLATWEMPSSRQCQEGHLSAPQRPRPGLLQLALVGQEIGQVVYPDEGVGVLGSQLGLAAFQGSAVETFCLAAPDGVLRCRNMRRAPAQAPCVMEREEKPTKATIFGL